jgi:hypothetical protein
MASPKSSSDFHQCEINKQIISRNLSADYHPNTQFVNHK